MQTQTIEWRNGTVITIDQSRLPHETLILELKSCNDVAKAIKTMKIRGAPLLGAAAAYALALTAYHSKMNSREKLVGELEKAAQTIGETRPTAVNLFWALDRILARARASSADTKAIASLVVKEAQKIAYEDIATNRLIGKYGATLIEDGDVVLTHCNAGALATVDYGTALGAVRAAWKQGKKIQVVATETRPKLQGARLTTYELKQNGIPVTLIADSAVGYLMYKRLINKVFVGADRIVRDAVINKIGTFTIAVLAKEHGVPFYVVAPKSTFDLARQSADVIIEERKPEEITHMGSKRIAPEGIGVMNPAFDLTPFEYVTAVICESGILYKEDFRKLKASLGLR